MGGSPLAQRQKLRILTLENAGRDARVFLLGVLRHRNSARQGETYNDRRTRGRFSLKSGIGIWNNLPSHTRHLFPSARRFWVECLTSWPRVAMVSEGLDRLDLPNNAAQPFYCSGSNHGLHAVIRILIVIEE